MSLIPWRGKQQDPDVAAPSSLASLRAEMDHLFDSFVREPLGHVEWPFFGEGKWAPPVDVAESENEVTVRVEVPGVNPADIGVTLTGNQLVVSGEKKETVERTGKEFHQSESRYGVFRRTVALPDEVDRDNVDAECANGVLTVTVRKIKPTPPKRVEVKSGEAGAGPVTGGPSAAVRPTTPHAPPTP